jgi:hypothetical protein
MGTAGTTQWGASEVSDRSARFGKAPPSQIPKAAVTKSQSIPNNLRAACLKPLGRGVPSGKWLCVFPGFCRGAEPGAFMHRAAILPCHQTVIEIRGGEGCRLRETFDRRGTTHAGITQRTAQRESALFGEARFIQSTVQQVSRGARRLDITALGWHERHSFGVQSSDS